MPLSINGRRHDDVDVMVSGEHDFLLVTVHEKEAGVFVHYQFDLKNGLQVIYS